MYIEHLAECLTDNKKTYRLETWDIPKENPIGALNMSFGYGSNFIDLKIHPPGELFFWELI